MQSPSVFRRGAGREAAQDGAKQALQGAPGGDATVAEKRGQRPGEGEDESAEQSLLQAKNQLALGPSGHQTVQTGHAASRVQLHFPPQAASGG